MRVTEKLFGCIIHISAVWYFNQHNEYISNLVETSSVLESAFDNFEPNAVGFLPLFYQSGYLTIKSYDKESKLYTLGLTLRQHLRCMDATAADVHWKQILTNEQLRH